MARRSRLQPLARAVLRTQTRRPPGRAGARRQGSRVRGDRAPLPAGLVAFAAAYGPPDPEDVVQESLLRSWDALRESTGEMHLKAWLYTIVRNRALNARRDARPHEQLDRGRSTASASRAEIVLTNEELGRAVAAIGALPTRSARRWCAARSRATPTTDRRRNRLDARRGPPADLPGADGRPPRRRAGHPAAARSRRLAEAGGAGGAGAAHAGGAAAAAARRGRGLAGDQGGGGRRDRRAIAAGSGDRARTSSQEPGNQADAARPTATAARLGRVRAPTESRGQPAPIEGPSARPTVRRSRRGRKLGRRLRVRGRGGWRYQAGRRGYRAAPARRATRPRDELSRPSKLSQSSSGPGGSGRQLSGPGSGSPGPGGLRRSSYSGPGGGDDGPEAEHRPRPRRRARTTAGPATTPSRQERAGATTDRVS